MTFIVGRSGSGKSTVTNLLLRFYQPSCGVISIDDHDLGSLDPSFLRNNMTVVQQETILFNETLLKNIAFGHQYHDHVDYEQIENCLDVAGLQPTVAALPEGVLTRVGVRGTALSGGQKQRVALARARLRDTPVLVLDEATGALDYIGRVAVMENIRRWRAGKTTIIITHDLSMINDDDYVYVLSAGSVAAQDHKRNLSVALLDEHGDDATRCPLDEVTFHLEQLQEQHATRMPLAPVLRRRLSVTSHQHVRTRRDSLEAQLYVVTQDRRSMASKYVRRTQLLGGFVSNRPSLVGVLDDLARPPMPTMPSHLRSSEQGDDTRANTSRRDTLPRQRAIYSNGNGAEARKAKRLPTPQVSDTTKAYRRMSTGKLFDSSSDTGRRALPLHKILATVWPRA